MSKNKEVKTAVKEESAPKKANDAHDALIMQIKRFSEDEIKAGTLKTKALGAIEVLRQMYPGLEESESDS